MFDKILIANRGEIACRVIKTARRMGIATVAVYSDADAGALHVRMADEAVHIGPPPVGQSYIVIDKILEAVQATGARGGASGLRVPVSERAEFAEALAAAGVAFIGPPAGAIRAMGDKITSKKLAAEAGVSTVPGYMGLIDDAGHAVTIARQIGYPVMIKASRRRRRQGHAHRLGRRRGARGVRAVAVGGGVELRRRPHLHREVRDPAAAHRDPGAGRQARDLPLPGRARVLDPAAEPEGDRGGAVAVPRRGDAARRWASRRWRWRRRWTTPRPGRWSSSSTASGTSTSSR